MGSPSWGHKVTLVASVTISAMLSLVVCCCNNVVLCLHCTAPPPYTGPCPYLGPAPCPRCPPWRGCWCWCWCESVRVLVTAECCECECQVLGTAAVATGQARARTRPPAQLWFIATPSPPPAASRQPDLELCTQTAPHRGNFLF